MKWAIAAVALALLASSASAQLTMQVEGENRPISPNNEARPVTLTIGLDCQVLLAEHPSAAGDTSVRLTTTSPDDNLLIQGPAETVVNVDKCNTTPNGRLELEVQFMISTTRDLPGLVVFVTKYEAALDATNPLGKSYKATDEHPVVSDYVPGISARQEPSIYEVAPGRDAVITFNLTNFGNADTAVEIALATPLADGLSADLPMQAIVARGETIQVTVPVHTKDETGYDNRDTAVSLVLTPHSSIIPEKVGEPVLLNSLVRVSSRSSGGDAPESSSPAVGPLLLLALASCAVATRRKRA